MRLAHSRQKGLSDRRGSRGAVMVEFAIMLPLLVLIILLIVDLAWCLRECQILENAAREGAHYSSLDRNWVGPRNPNASIANIKQVVINYCSQENITVQAADINVTQAFPINVGGNVLHGSEVTVSYPRQFVIRGAGLLPSGQMTLVGRAVFLNQYGD